MRGFFTRRKKPQSADGTTVQGPLAQIRDVQGDVHVTLAAVPPQPQAPDVESAREAYAARIRQRYGRLDLEVLTPLREQDEHPVVHLRDVFVPQSVRADPPPVELPQELLRRLMDPAEAELHDLPPGIDRETAERVRRAYRERPPLPVLDVLTAPEHDRIVILGHPGSGKSTLARYLALALTSPEPPPSLAGLRGKLPLIVELREYAQPAWRERTFEDFLAHQYASEGLGLPQETLAALLAGEGPYTALVIFDGLDELFEKGVRDAVTRCISGFAARHPRARIVVTSRGYGYQRAVLDGADFTNFMLQDLDRDQIGAFAEQWFSLAYPEDPEQSRRLIERVTAAVDASASVRELAGNPLILTILAIIGRRRELPRDRRTVYEHAVDVLVEHWDPSKYLRDRQVEEHLPYLGPEDKRELLRLIARQMQEGHGGVSGNHIAGPDLLKSFEEYLKDRYALPPDRAATAARVMLDQFRHRNFILSRFGGEIYGFVHRTFLEYLVAMDLAHRFHRERSLSEEDLQDLFASKVHDPTWHETLLLLVGLLDERFVAGVIDRLLAPRAIAVPVGTHDDTAFIEVAFAVRCLGEVRRLGALASQTAAMIRTVTRLFEFAGALDVDFFFPFERIESLGPALAALGDHWEGRDDYLRWHQRWSHGRGIDDEWSMSANTTEQLAADILLLLQSRGEPPCAAQLEATALTGGSPVARIGAVRLLVRRSGGEPATRALVERCLREDTNGFVRAALLGYLAFDDGADPDWMARLAVERLAQDEEQQVRTSAFDCLRHLRSESPDARAAFDRLSYDSDPRVRRQAMDFVVARSESGADAAEGLRAALTAVDPGRRATALSAVAARTGDEPEVRALVQERLKNDESPEVVAAAISAVREIGSEDPGMHALLRELSGHQVAEVRTAALSCLADVDSPDEVLSELLSHRLAHDEDRGVRATALRLFVEHVEDDSVVRDVLLDRLRNDQDLVNQRQALRRLVELDPEAARDLVVDRARNHADGLRPWVHTYLLTTYRHDAEAVRLVVDQAVKGASNDVRASALRSLLENSADHELAVLAHDRFANDPDPAVRLTALRILADLRRDDPGLLPVLRQAIANEDGEIRECAAAILAVLAPHAP